MAVIALQKTSGEKQEEFIIEQSGMRLDLAISNNTSLNRSMVQNLIKEKKVTVGGLEAKANYRVKKGDMITVILPEKIELKLISEKVSLPIIYEDEDLIVVNKPQGMVVHPAVGNYSGTLVNALLAHCGDSLSGINGVLRPGIVHRLDKDTSGLIVVAKNDLAHLGLSKQLKDKTMYREYLVLVHGVVNESSWLVDAPIGRHPINRKKMAVTEKGKPAVTRFQVIKRFSNYTMLKARLETGRTHQIRVHCAFINHPVVGDPVYGPKRPHFNLTGQLLHAQKLCFIHPRTGEKKEFTVPATEHFQEILANIETGNILSN